MDELSIIEEGALIKCVSRGLFLFQYRERDYDTQTCTAIKGSVIRVTEGRGVIGNFEHIFPMGRCYVLSEYVEVDNDYFRLYNNSKTV